MQQVKCAYCDGHAHLVTGAVIYPHRPDLASKKFWNCGPCKAYVGCHPISKHHKTDDVPLGRLANAELRKLKSLAHAAFDPKWRFGGFTRKEAYGILADRLGIKRKDCHIGMFDEKTCREVIEISQEDWKG
jgi:hypothetical protein